MNEAAKAKHWIPWIVERDQETSPGPERGVELVEREQDLRFAGEVIERGRRDDDVEAVRGEGESANIVHAAARESRRPARVREDYRRHIHQDPSTSPDEWREGFEATG